MLGEGEGGEGVTDVGIRGYGVKPREGTEDSRIRWCHTMGGANEGKGVSVVGDVGEAETEVEVCFKEPGGDLNSDFEVGEGFVMAAEGTEGDTEIILGFGVAGLERDGAVEVG